MFVNLPYGEKYIKLEIEEALEIAYTIVGRRDVWKMVIPEGLM